VLLDDPHLEEGNLAEIERLHSTADDRKKDALRAPADDARVQVEVHLVRGLDVAEVIRETCSEVGCDLVVVGTHGRRGVGHLLLGSVAEKVVRTAPVPVLTVHRDARLPDQGLRSLLVAHDFSEHSSLAVRQAAGWAEILGAEVTLLHVVEPVVYPEFYSVDLLPDEIMSRLRDRSSQALDAAASELLGDVPYRTDVVTGKAGESIVAAASAEDVDLVVIGTRGLSAVESLLLGSVAEYVMRKCPVPLLAVRG
jgi:nucleotide-binding universal stress UspA family protein